MAAGYEPHLHELPSVEEFGRQLRNPRIPPEEREEAMATYLDNWRSLRRYVENTPDVVLSQRQRAFRDDLPSYEHPDVSPDSVVVGRLRRYAELGGAGAGPVSEEREAGRFMAPHPETNELVTPIEATSRRTLDVSGAFRRAMRGSNLPALAAGEPTTPEPPPYEGSLGRAGRLLEAAGTIAGDVAGSSPELLIGGAAGLASGPAAPVVAPAVAFGLMSGGRAYRQERQEDALARAQGQLQQQQAESLGLPAPEVQEPERRGITLPGMMTPLPISGRVAGHTAIGAATGAAFPAAAKVGGALGRAIAGGARSVAGRRMGEVVIEAAGQAPQTVRFPMSGAPRMGFDYLTRRPVGEAVGALTGEASLLTAGQEAERALDTGDMPSLATVRGDFQQNLAMVTALKGATAGTKAAGEALRRAIAPEGRGPSTASSEAEGPIPSSYGYLEGPTEPALSGPPPGLPPGGRGPRGVPPGPGMRPERQIPRRPGPPDVVEGQPPPEPFVTYGERQTPEAYQAEIRAALARARHERPEEPELVEPELPAPEMPQRPMPDLPPSPRGPVQGAAAAEGPPPAKGKKARPPQPPRAAVPPEVAAREAESTAEIEPPAAVEDAGAVRQIAAAEEPLSPREAGMSWSDFLQERDLDPTQVTAQHPRYRALRAEFEGVEEELAPRDRLYELEGELADAQRVVDTGQNRLGKPVPKVLLDTLRNSIIPRMTREAEQLRQQLGEGVPLPPPVARPVRSGRSVEEAIQTPQEWRDLGRPAEVPTDDEALADAMDTVRNPPPGLRTLGTLFGIRRHPITDQTVQGVWVTARQMSRGAPALVYDPLTKRWVRASAWVEATGAEAQDIRRPPPPASTPPVVEAPAPSVEVPTEPAPVPSPEPIAEVEVQPRPAIYGQKGRSIDDAISTAKDMADVEEPPDMPLWLVVEGAADVAVKPPTGARNPVLRYGRRRHPASGEMVPGAWTTMAGKAVGTPAYVYDHLIGRWVRARVWREAMEPEEMGHIPAKVVRSMRASGEWPDYFVPPDLQEAATADAAIAAGAPEGELGPLVIAAEAPFLQLPMPVQRTMVTLASRMSAEGAGAAEIEARALSVPERTRLVEAGLWDPSEMKLTSAGEDALEMATRIRNAASFQVIPKMGKRPKGLRAHYSPKEVTPGERAFKVAFTHVSSDETRYNLGGVNVEKDLIVATDGHRLIVIPGKPGVKPGTYNAAMEPMAVAGEYPAWRQVVPKGLKVAGRVTPEEMIAAGDATVRAGRIIAFARGERRTFHPLGIGKALFNAQYIADAGRAFAELGIDEVEIALSEPVKVPRQEEKVVTGPATMREVGREDGVLIIIMPVRESGSIAQLPVGKPGANLDRLAAPRVAARRRGQEGAVFPRSAQRLNSNSKLDDFFEETRRPTDPITRIRYEIRNWFVQMFGEHSPELRNDPELRNSFRLLRDRPQHIVDGAESDLLEVMGELADAGHEEDFRVFERAIVYRDVLTRIAQGEIAALPRGFTPETWREGYVELMQAASPAVKRALMFHDGLMRREAMLDIQRGSLPASVLSKDSYFPWHVFAYSDYLGRQLPGLPRSLREPARPWTRKAGGTERDINTNYIGVMRKHLIRIRLARELDDFALTWLKRRDVAPFIFQEETGLAPGTPKAETRELGALAGEAQETHAKRMGLPKPDHMLGFEWQGRRYRYYRYQRWGNRHYLVSTPIDQVALDVLTPTLESMKGERFYIIPDAMAQRFHRWRYGTEERYAETFRAFWPLWKRVIIDTLGLPFQLNNLMGDALQLYAEDAIALFKAFPVLPQGVNIARYAAALRNPGPRLERIINDPRARRFFGELDPRFIDFLRGHSIARASGFYGGEVPRMASRRLREMESGEPRGIIRRAGRALLEGGRILVDGYEYLMSVREDWARIASGLENFHRIQRGELPHHFVVDVRGLTPLQAAGKIAREFGTDYGAVGENLNELRVIIAPFVTWYLWQTKYWPTYVKLVAAGGRQGPPGDEPPPLEMGAWRELPPPGGTPPGGQPPRKLPPPAAAGEGEGRMHGGPSAGQRVAQGLKIGLPLALLFYWNFIHKGEDEADVSDYLRGRLFHINLGKDDSGKIRVISFPVGPDVPASLIGVHKIIPAVHDFMLGRLTEEELMWEVGRDVAFSAPLEALRQLGPIFQIPAGLISNQDQWTRRRIVPEDLLHTPEADALRAQWILEKLIPVWGVAAQSNYRMLRDPRALPGTGAFGRFVELLRSGPLSLERTIGLRREDPLLRELEKQRELNARLVGKRASMLSQLESQHHEAVATGDPSKWERFRTTLRKARDATSQDFHLSMEEWMKRTETTRFKRDEALIRAGHATSLAERERWVNKYEQLDRELRQQSVSRVPKSVQKAAQRRRAVLERQR